MRFAILGLISSVALVAGATEPNPPTFCDCEVTYTATETGTHTFVPRVIWAHKGDNCVRYYNFAGGGVTGHVDAGQTCTVKLNPETTEGKPFQCLWAVWRPDGTRLYTRVYCREHYDLLEKQGFELDECPWHDVQSPTQRPRREDRNGRTVGKHVAAPERPGGGAGDR